MDRVRDAMVPEPRTLRGDSPAQEAGELLSKPQVRAVFVREGEKLVGVVTRGTLVRDVVAAGRDPRTTPVREIAEPPRHTLDPELPLDEAFQFLEDEDLERVPVTRRDGSSAFSRAALCSGVWPRTSHPLWTRIPERSTR
jgi:CBS domain-containing protein